MYNIVHLILIKKKSSSLYITRFHPYSIKYIFLSLQKNIPLEINFNEKKLLVIIVTNLVTIYKLKIIDC